MSRSREFRFAPFYFFNKKKFRILTFVCFSCLTATSQQLRHRSYSSLAVPGQNVSAVSNDKKIDKPPERQLSMELYGFVMTNVIYDFKQMDPKWYDILRPTKLPAYENQFAPNGQVYFSMRQTRFGIRGNATTPWGAFKTWFEFDLLGSGPDAGQTTIHLRHAWGEIGKFGVGQTWSTFMDPDVIPNSLDYWEPNGMVFYRNIQLRYMPLQGTSRFFVALEKPGGTADEGVYADHIELKGAKAHFTLPDLSTQLRIGKSWAYIQLAGILRQLKWKDTDTLGTNFSGKKVGWGLNLSSGISCFKKDRLHLQVVYGEGIENYLRDAPSDLSVQSKGTSMPEAVTLPVLGTVAFYDHYWGPKFTSTIGYS